MLTLCTPNNLVSASSRVRRDIYPTSPTNRHGYAIYESTDLLAMYPLSLESSGAAALIAVRQLAALDDSAVGSG